MLKTKHKSLYLILLFPISLLIKDIAHKNPSYVETYYSQIIYSKLSNIIGKISGLFPFSIIEILIVALIITIFYHLIKIIKMIIKKDENLKNLILKIFLRILVFSSLVYFLFIYLCGVNYARPKYAELTNISIEDSSVSELKELTIWIISETNLSRSITISNSEEVFSLSRTKSELSKEAANIISVYGEKNKLFSGYTPPTKPVIFSYIMSHLNITGVYSPFTFEANVNLHQPDYGIPSTMLHELAHFKGFMNESDANFIAFFIGNQSNNPDFVYSSNMLALVHTLNAYHSVSSPEEYDEVYNLLSTSVKKDLRFNNEYWKQFETPVADVSEKINDNYLKNNHQEAGVKSYGEMVDYLMAYYKDKIRSK